MAGVSEVLGAIGPVAALAFAAWAAWEARRAANASEAAVVGQIVYSAMEEYFQPIMAEDIRVLRAWREKHNPSFAASWLVEFQQQTPEAVRVEEARRRVKGYFVRAARLHSNELISHKGFHAIAYVNGLNVFYDIVVPLGIALNPDASRRTEKLLMEEIGRYEHRAPRA